MMGCVCVRVAVNRPAQVRSHVLLQEPNKCMYHYIVYMYCTCVDQLLQMQWRGLEGGLGGYNLPFTLNLTKIVLLRPSSINCTNNELHMAKSVLACYKRISLTSAHHC